MLVLSRKCEQSVVVGRPDNGEPLITVTVLEISGSRVSLGFTALTAVPIHRSEVWERRTAAFVIEGQPDGPAIPAT